MEEASQMKILFVDDSKASLVMYPQTDGFLRVLSQNCEVQTVMVDTSQEEYDLREYKGVDVVLIWQSVTSHRHKDIVRLFRLPPQSLSCAVISDFFHPYVKRTPTIYNPFLLRTLEQSKIDVVFSTYFNTYEWSLLLPESKIFYLPYCVDVDFFKNLGEKRAHRLLVCCSTDTYLYPFRTRVIELLYNQTEIPCLFKVNAHEQWGNTKDQMELEGDARRTVAYAVLESYRDLLNRHSSFLAITSIGNGVELKFSEAILCGACVVPDIPSTMFQHYGSLFPVIHSCMTDSQIISTISVYMNNPDYYLQQRDKARALIVNDYSPDTCVRTFLDTIEACG